jgi:hypothetical protein
MKILLVWNEVLENLRFFGLNKVSHEQLKVLGTANNMYINGDDMDEAQDAALNHINAALADPKYAQGFEEDEKDWLSIWVGQEITPENLPKAGKFDQVFSCGLLMDGGTDMANWQRTLDMRDVWEIGDVCLVAQTAADRLRALKPFEIEDIDWEKENLIDELEDLAKDDPSPTTDEFDYIWDKVYDWADTLLEGEARNGKKVCWIRTF